MNCAPALIVAALLCLADGQRPGALARLSERYLQLPVKYNVGAYIGTPGRWFALELSFQFSELIVLDASCGERKTDCEKYCGDEFFMPIYCSPLCQSFTPQMRAALCIRSKIIQVYNASRTETAKSDGKKWLRRIGGLRTLYGVEWTDRLVVHSEVNFGQPVLWIERIGFVSALLFDMRTLDDSSGMFGVAPGDGNPLLQLIEQRGFAKRVATFGDNRSNKFHQNKNGGRLMTVSQLDKANCADFRWFPSVSDHAWAFVVERIDFMGLEVNERTLILLALGQRHTIIPTDLGARLLRENIVKTYSPDLYRNCPDSNIPDVRLFTKTAEILLDKSSMLKAAFGRSSPLCYLYVRMHSTSPYATSGVWMLGDNVLNQYCVALDYKSGMIGLALKREGSAFERN